MQEWFKKNGPVDGEDLERHDKWLAMMWPRLHLLKELLSDDGVIFVSIDDNEQHHLRMLMDEIFGEDQFLSTVTVKSNPGGRDYGGIAKTHDFVVIYGKTVYSSLSLVGIDDANLAYRDKLGGFELRELRNRNSKFNSSNRPNLYYPFYVNLEDTDGNGLSPISLVPQEGWVEVYPAETNGVKTVWRWQPSTVLDNIDHVAARRNRNGGVHILEKFRPIGKRERSILDSTEYRNEAGTLMFKSIFGDDITFDYPKSTSLLMKLVELGTNKDSLVLDSFAGSATTAHAVLALNKEDGGNRKFILVEREDHIANDITAERVRRVIKGVSGAKDKSLKDGLGGSFTYATLGEPIDIDSMLTGENLPAYETLASWLLHTATGLSAPEKELRRAAKHEIGLFHSTETTNFHLLYRPDSDWLRSNEGMLNEDKARRISELAQENGRRAIVFGPGKYMGQRELTDKRITFAQLPYELQTRMTAGTRG